MASVATCTDPWQVDTDGGVLCPGTVQVVDDSAYQTMPGLTYPEANQLIAAALFVLALAWVIRRVLRLLR